MPATGNFAVWQAALDAADVPLLAVTYDLEILLANQAFYSLYQVPADVQDERQLLAAVPQLRDTAVLTAIAEAALQRAPQRVAPSLGSAFLAARVECFPWGLLVRLDEQRLQQELDRTQWELLDGIAHAFQTPLTSLVGYAETLLKPEVLGMERQRGFAERIYAQSNHLARIVDDVIFLSRLNAAQSQLELGELDLRLPVLDAVQAALPEAEKKGLGLDVHVAKEALLVAGNYDALFELTLNLLSNAVKYTEFGGMLAVTVTADGESVSLSVADDGMGIPAASLAHVFDRFYRGENVRGSGLPGAGLGLAKVRSIAIAHHGQLDVQSAVDQGTTFTLRLPLLA